MKDIAIQNDVKQRVALLSRTILNRPNLERLIDETRLRDKIGPDLDREALLKRLEEDIALFDASGARSLYTVTYPDADPVLARDVVTAVLDQFIDTVVGG